MEALFGPIQRLLGCAASNQATALQLSTGHVSRVRQIHQLCTGKDTV